MTDHELGRLHLHVPRATIEVIEMVAVAVAVGVARSWRAALLGAAGAGEKDVDDDVGTGFDWTGFVLSFKGVALEGLEVASRRRLQLALVRRHDAASPAGDGSHEQQCGGPIQDTEAQQCKLVSRPIDAQARARGRPDRVRRGAEGHHDHGLLATRRLVEAGVAAWWVLPLVVLAANVQSLRGAVRRDGR